MVLTALLLTKIQELPGKCSLQPFVLWEEQSQGLLVVTVLPDSYGMVLGLCFNFLFSKRSATPKQRYFAHPNRFLKTQCLLNYWPFIITIIFSLIISPERENNAFL